MLHILQEPEVRRLMNSAESDVRGGHGPFSPPAWLNARSSMKHLVKPPTFVVSFY